MKKIIKTEKRYAHILLFSIFFSIILHSLAVFSLYKHFLAYTPLNKFFKVVMSERRSGLFPTPKREEVFIFSLNQKKMPGNGKGIAHQSFNDEGDGLLYVEPKPEMVEKIAKNSFKENNVKEEKFKSSSTFTPSLNIQKEPFIKKNIARVDVAFQIQKKDNTSHFINCLKAKAPEIKKTTINQKCLYTSYTILSPESTKNKAVVPHIERCDQYISSSKDIFVVNSSEERKAISDYLRKEILKMQDLQISESKAAPFLPFVPHIPSLADLHTISCGDDFDLDLEYVSKDDDLGYIFALTLIPKVERQFQRINQNFYFLIDKSNSIKNDRYTSTRQALISSINAMNKGDTFNIFAFDNKLDILFKKSKNPTPEFISSAKNFLISKKLAPFFSSKSLTLPFSEMLENPINNDEINNIILISNGEDLDKQKNCRLINQFSDLNSNKQSLYILALESDKNLPLLEMFAAKNNGQLIVSHTVKSIRKNLLRLVKSLNYPVAKHVSICTQEKDRNVWIFSQKNKQNHLYYDQPYVLLGTVKSLDDFVIFIQGKNSETWFNIKKKISFENARMGGNALSDKWAQYRANQYYDKYLKDGDVKNLKLAEDILLPRDLTPAFKK